MGGTFNPPHNGHIWAAQNAVRQLRLDKMILMPTGIPPHKILPEGSASPAQRLAMARLAAREIPGAEVSDMEMGRQGASYTVDTMTELRKRYPEDELFLIVGTDMLMTFDRWYQPEAIARLCGLAVVARSETDLAAIERKAKALQQSIGAQVHIVRCHALELSSTEIRKKEKDGMPRTVAEYIKTQGLYE